MQILRTRRIAATVIAVALLCMSSIYAGARFTTKITVVNGSTMNIIKILASADGENYESFNVGRGIRPGKSRVFPINESNRPCDLQIKVMYADRSETAPVRVNTCEKDATVEFTD